MPPSSRDFVNRVHRGGGGERPPYSVGDAGRISAASRLALPPGRAGALARAADRGRSEDVGRLAAEVGRDGRGVAPSAAASGSPSWGTGSLMDSFLRRAAMERSRSASPVPRLCARAPPSLRRPLLPRFALDSRPAVERRPALASLA